MVSELVKNWSGRARLITVVCLPVVWAVGLFIFMNITSPLQNGPLSVLAVFTLIYLFLTSALYVAAIAGSKLAKLLGGKAALHRKQLYYLVSVIALGPVFILALNTLGQLEIKEVILVVMLLVIGCFYVLRRSRKEAL